MKLWNRKTEAEHIESVRKLTGRSKWFAVFFGAMFLFFLVLLTYAWNLGMNSHELLADAHGSVREELAESFPRQILIGVPFGLLMGLFLVFALSCLGNVFQVLNGFRNEKLMLKYHDRLKEKAENFKQADSNVFSEDAPSKNL